MTEEAAVTEEAKVEPAVAAAPVAADPTPTIDVEAIKSEIASYVEDSVGKATGGVDKAVESALTGVFKRLAGEEVKEDNLYHKTFLEDPEGFTKAIRDAAVEQATSQIKDAQSRTRAHQGVLSEWEQKVPGISKYNFEVTGRYNNIKAANKGISEKDALAQALEQTVEHLDLKVLSDEEVQQHSALAPSMGVGGTESANANLEAAATDFIQAQKERARGLRTRK